MLHHTNTEVHKYLFAMAYEAHPIYLRTNQYGKIVFNINDVYAGLGIPNNSINIQMILDKDDIYEMEYITYNGFMDLIYHDKLHLSKAKVYWAEIILLDYRYHGELKKRLSMQYRYYYDYYDYYDYDNYLILNDIFAKNKSEKIF